MNHEDYLKNITEQFHDMNPAAKKQFIRGLRKSKKFKALADYLTDQDEEYNALCRFAREKAGI